MGRLVRGSVYLCELGSPDKTRPVVILTRTPSIELLNKITVAPITTTIRDSPSQVYVDEDDGLKFPCAINLHQILTVRKVLLTRRIGQLSAEKMHSVAAAIRYSLALDLEEVAEIDRLSYLI